MKICWSGDGNEAIYYSVYEPKFTPDYHDKYRCAECANAIADAAIGVTDDQLKQILDLKVARKGAKLSTAIAKLKAKWAEDARAESIPKRQEHDW